MSRTETVRMRTINEKVVIVRCDVCNRTARSQCVGCNRDICERCTVYDERDHGDYPDKYCQRCWKIGEPYRKNQDELSEEIDASERRWMEECKCSL